MRFFGAALAAVLMIAACDRVPGTAENKAASIIRNAAFDPDAAKISMIKTTPHAVCGTVNGKNRMGAYVGATPFIYDKATGKAVIYTGPTDTYDVRRLADLDIHDPEHDELFNKIDTECRFPHEWDLNCKVTMPGKGGGRVCDVWLSDGDGPWKIMRELRQSSY